MCSFCGMSSKSEPTTPKSGSDADKLPHVAFRVSCQKRTKETQKKEKKKRKRNAFFLSLDFHRFFLWEIRRRSVLRSFSSFQFFSIFFFQFFLFFAASREKQRRSGGTSRDSNWIVSHWRKSWPRCFWNCVQGYVFCLFSFFLFFVFFTCF